MNASTMRRLRQYHRDLGLFFAPAILFFAVTGAGQTLGFQDRAAGYVPPRWIAVLAGIHKHQAIPKPGSPKPGLAPHASPAKHAAPTDAPSPWPLKIFAVLMSIGLALASSLGILIALVPRATRWRAALFLGAGVMTPILLLIL